MKKKTKNKLFTLMLERGVQGKEKIVLKALKLKQKGEIGGNPQNTHKRKEEKKKKD